MPTVARIVLADATVCFTSVRVWIHRWYNVHQLLSFELSTRIVSWFLMRNLSDNDVPVVFVVDHEVLELGAIVDYGIVLNIKDIGKSGSFPYCISRRIYNGLRWVAFYLPS